MLELTFPGVVLFIKRTVVGVGWGVGGIDDDFFINNHTPG